ncbi:hypothetical protein HDV05_008618 [Chytridiales sp. JEL 0842]|nr:hypothetical protein HDV05_008618 [Chytridiales sp. JEL 0842]
MDSYTHGHQITSSQSPNLPNLAPADMNNNNAKHALEREDTTTSSAQTAISDMVAAGGDINTTDPNTGSTAWHALPTPEHAVAKLESSLTQGLTSSEAARRLNVYGRNVLTPAKKTTFWKKLWDQLNNVLVFILIVAAIVTGALREWAECGLIVGVVVINVAIGLVQEGKAEKAAEAIKAMLSSSATILRDGQKIQVSADMLVPGDIVYLKSGDRVPADLRLVSINNLQILESMLTGESLPVSKNKRSVDATAGLGDRKCMAFSATTCLQGQGVGVVVATGDNAEIGKISAMVSRVPPMKTNLIIQMEILGRWLAVVIGLISLAAFLLAVFRAKQSFITAFKIAVAIAVAIIPEGLPAIVTITLAIGTTIMARNNAIIRQLPCVETLGSLTVICSDKTGTLTKNEMTVVRVRTSSLLARVSGVGYAPHGKFTDDNTGADLTAAQHSSIKKILTGAVLCNDSSLNSTKDPKTGKEEFIPTGAPTEVSLITAALKAGISLAEAQTEYPRVGAIPFESLHKFMATVHKSVSEVDGEPVIYVKGAPDRLLQLCNTQLDPSSPSGDDTVAIDKDWWIAEQERMSAEGLRVLALCRATLPSDLNISTLNPTALLERSKTPFLTLIAMIAILDPPREEAIEAVGIAHQAGIQVKMITGDHPLTAQAIGKMLGLKHDGGDSVVYTGPQVDAMSDEELDMVVEGCNIFARASPENKLRIVRSLQRRGQITAMTGDGVNDAPALKAAHVGVAMGITGTDVTKEASKMVLADDNFASIVKAVKEGRRVWDNLRKIVLFNLPVNFAQGCCILWAYIIGFSEVPLTAIQVLYVNLATAVTMGLMLAVEPAEGDIMQRPPRKTHKKLLGKLILWRIFFVSTLLIILVDTIFWWGELQGYTLPQRRAEALNVLVFGEIGYSITARFIKAPSWNPKTFFTNYLVFVLISLTAAIQVFLTYTPVVNTFFSQEGLDAYQWGRVLISMVIVYVIVEVEKALVDPVLMPFVRPILRWMGHVSPKWLKASSIEREEAVKVEEAEGHHEHHEMGPAGVVVDGDDKKKKEKLVEKEEGWSENSDGTFNVPN